ncbi:MAG: SHOCT domain-containing protein [Phycisphaeraceae bacterium]|nr:SHOCT domain-containing protein [Phycisphaeraceae bacterium]
MPGAPLQLAETSLGPYLLWIAVLIGVVLLATFGILVLRRRLLEAPSARRTDAGVMDELRALRDQGKISTEEFDAARKRIVARIAAQSLASGLPDAPGAAPARPAAARRPAPPGPAGPGTAP